MNPVQINNPNPGSILIDNLRTFLHLTTQAPLELVCKSSLYLLTHVPATRPAVFEYIGTFYKVTTFLHIRFILSQKSQPNRDTTQEANNINHINQVIDLIENSLSDLLRTNASNELWSLELAQWMIDLIGEIVSNNGLSFAETPGLSIEELTQFKNLNLIDALELWSIQCKPTKSILSLIRKCFATCQEPNKMAMFDLIFTASSKYSSQFDWILCDLSSLNAEFIFENCLKCGYNDYATANGKLNRIHVINFYASNFSTIVKNSLVEFLNEIHSDSLPAKKSSLIYLLAISSVCSSLANLILNEILSDESEYGCQMVEFLNKCVIELNECDFVKNFIDSIMQISNSIAVFDLIFNSIEWLKLNRVESKFDQFIYKLIENFLDEIELNIYAFNSEGKQDSLPFLKGLNTINATSFKLMLDQIIYSIKQDFPHKDLLNKLLTVIALSGNTHVASSVMKQLMLVPVKFDHNESPFIIKFRQEINLFHPTCLRNTIMSVSKNLLNEPNTNDLNTFLDNLTLLYDWDLKNKKYLSENISFILIDNECFVSMISQLGNEKNTKSSCSLYLLDLYSRILESNEESVPMLRLNVADILICAKKLVDHLFLIFDLMNTENIGDLANELNLLNDIFKHTVIHLIYLNEEKSPYRNIILRTLVDKFFEYSKHPPLHVLEDEYGETSNLFNSNLNITNSELMVEKSRFKAFQNSHLLAKKHALTKNLNNCMSMMNFAFMELIELICSRNFENTEAFMKFQEQKYPLKCDTDSGRKEKILLNEQMTNLADLIIQRIYLENHYIDYQWPNSNANDNDENFEGEVECIKLFIERDVYVQNVIENPKINRILWSLLEFLAQDEPSFNRCSPIIRSLLASIIIQWDSIQDQPATNLGKFFDITLRLLNLLNKSPNLLPRPLCYIVDIVPFISSYETHICLILIWRYLRAKFQPLPKSLLGATNKPNAVETKHLRFIFQKNISKLDYLYSRFFKNI